MRKHHLIALIWALINVALATKVPLPPRAGWPMILAIGFFPACFIFFADFIAAHY
jgi:hypothetical protein